MSKRSTLIVAGAGGIVLLALVAGYLAGPLFINRTVDEPAPFATLGGDTDLDRLMSQVPSEAELTAMPETERLVVQDTLMQDFAALPGTSMDEAMPAGPAQPTVVSTGEFSGADSFHKGSGTAILYAQTDGSYLLRLENLDVTNGPDLYVVLSENPAPTDSSMLGEHVLFDRLKGNRGNQNYMIPAGTDVSKFKSAVIYCKRFAVVFATAALGAEGS
jgi:hypothetical protein